MFHHTLTLSDQKVLDHAHELLKEHLPLEAKGYVCTTDDLYSVLLGVAAKRGDHTGDASGLSVAIAVPGKCGGGPHRSTRLIGLS